MSDNAATIVRAFQPLALYYDADGIPIPIPKAGDRCYVRTRGGALEQRLVISTNPRILVTPPELTATHAPPATISSSSSSSSKAPK